MKNHTATALVAVFFCCSTFAADAANCRAGTAAQTGSEAGYNTAKKASDAWSARESQTSDQLQNCLSGIRNISISLPNLPSLQDIMNQASEKVCSALTDKINSNLPDNIDPWQSYGL
ncbi:TraL protein [Kosakonia radicincitans]|uniref:TraL protein n=1 Tax=Kosakonia radicincitans TaxID=283686 RepID=A0AAX2EZF7_9ENTR|nr:conjugal transfer protein [Kosakonia radicincitans]SFF38016.1 TraL protein [Kosakonia radicincitans]SFR26235.1 TraL protein [Kosakonia radicincitans]SFU16735.1 TraL protein [Kosakonia radicincitans]SFY31992.1 TraL protein [Kosakonia radicincitans]